MDATIYTLTLLQLAIATLQSAVDPIVFALLAVGILTALVQGALQVDDAALGFAIKLGAVALATGAFAAALITLENFARAWIGGIPGMLGRNWS